MNRRAFIGALALAGLGLAGGATGASADHYDRWDYRRYHYFRGRDRDEIRQREYLRYRMFDIAERIRLGDREGDLGRNRAARFYDRLDDVRDFLRDDRHLSDSEFHRRRDDLEDIERDLREALRRSSRYDRVYRDRFYDRNPSYRIYRRDEYDADRRSRYDDDDRFYRR
jgi:hypothetical protein